jgi:hypothetical protein
MKLLTILLAAAALSAQTPAPAFKSDLLIGTWKVNWDKSKAPNQRPAADMPTLIRQYRRYGDGFMLHTVLRAAPGQMTVPELDLIAAVKYDNREYPTFTPERLTNLFTAGKQPAQSVSFKSVGPYNLEWADRTSGKITADGTMELSPDGSTMTFITRGYNAEGKPTRSSTLIFEKIAP